MANHEPSKQEATVKPGAKEPPKKPKLPNAANLNLLVNLREGDRNQRK
jgi:hypothetical protein